MPSRDCLPAPAGARELVREEEGGRVIRVHRRAYTDPDIFEAEMRSLFEGGWIYLAHESELPGPGAFVSTWMGREPVLLLRERTGALRGLVNACSHRGARLVARERGEARQLVCPYHGWCFDLAGRCTKRKDERTGWSHRPAPGEADLRTVARVESYRGFVFGSLSPEVPPLEAYLGPARVFIDLLADQSEAGLEILPGRSSYVVECNWKLQMENGVDGYHVGTVHRNFATTMARRNARIGDNSRARTEIDRISGRVATGAYDLGNGHSVLWAGRGTPEAAPLWEARERLEPVVGAVRWEWMCARGRNLFLFPNVFLMDQSSTQVRVLRPLEPGRTLVEVACIAPRGESREARRSRLAKFRDFFLMSGLATPDDSVVLEETQRAVGGPDPGWNVYDRGVDRQVAGPDEEARRLGLEPVASSGSFDHEVIHHGQYRAWAARLGAGAVDTPREPDARGGT